ncbi:glutathione S-transferase [Pontixanthobacter aestiaquae]|uniref:Glutathione S-transferase n=1 Tax=Pontixanthobacter aestiaquae TaxID=1509367 RepID=A0A844Z2S1_9SPHN|nr:glutathione S-transferase [Pontixanthobacter aestiaquae]MDN3647240.1 glutathione S-transferase [Pontixanthobacter aestiaquae]MXO81784.1 glutathione S-transferase [Pontixanthobacter aestiaquae]
MADAPILYSFRRCPYAMRARMALAISETEVEHREVVLREKPEAMLEASPKGTVPVVVLEDGTVIEESVDVMRWSLGKNDPEDWLSGDDRDLIAMIDGPFKHHLDRYKYSTRHDTDPEEHRHGAYAILEQLEARLGGQKHLCGDARSMADIATFPFIRQFANTDREWFDAQPLPNLQRWLAEHLESPLFKQIMVKHDQWKESA